MREVMGPDPWYFIWSLASGIILGFLYDILRLQRKIIRTCDIVVNVEDILFIILGGITATVLAYVVNNGFFRAYSLISIGLGFCLYRLTVGSRIVDAFACVYMLACKSVELVLKFMLIPASWTIRMMNGTVFVTVRCFGSLTKIKKGKKSKYINKYNRFTKRSH